MMSEYIPMFLNLNILSVGVTTKIWFVTVFSNYSLHDVFDMVCYDKWTRNKLQPKSTKHNWLQYHKHNPKRRSVCPVVACSRNYRTNPLFIVCVLFKVWALSWNEKSVDSCLGENLFQLDWHRAICLDTSGTTCSYKSWFWLMDFWHESPTLVIVYLKLTVFPTFVMLCVLSV